VRPTLGYVGIFSPTEYYFKQMVDVNSEVMKIFDFISSSVFVSGALISL
jgi:hypothetical protein